MHTHIYIICLCERNQFYYTCIEHMYHVCVSPFGSPLVSSMSSAPVHYFFHSSMYIFSPSGIRSKTQRKKSQFLVVQKWASKKKEYIHEKQECTHVL